MDEYFSGICSLTCLVNVNQASKTSNSNLVLAIVNGVLSVKQKQEEGQDQRRIYIYTYIYINIFENRCWP